MNSPAAHHPVTACSWPSATHRRQERRGAFALVITLLILSLLIVVAVSYLSSMIGERQTADAYTSKARAEQVAQAGVDSAMAILTESFRDFPDSATAWDPTQSQNSGTSNSSFVVSSPYNEGTDLYLRAVPATASVNGASLTVANPQPEGAPAPGATPIPANDSVGNNPNNPACKNFVLPLISGVPGGRAQLASNKAGMLPTMNLGEPDPAKQNFVDLNVRRFGPNPASADPVEQKYGDYHGVIGSPPEWTGTPKAAPNSVVGPTSGSGYGPKPARALWVNLKDSADRVTGRYAFWIEDESFRTNVNYVGNAQTRADNSPDGKTVVDTSTPPQPRSVLPSDMSLTGTIIGFDGNNASTDADSVVGLSGTRAAYPGKFLPDPLAFTHSTTNGTGAPTLLTPTIDGLRYLSTTQSGSLNLTRHGTQRLNLNALTTINPNAPVTMTEIRKLVETIRFHLPNFGQRFYRTTNPDTAAASQKPSILNNPTNVSAANAEIYLYKTAANLRDYIDTDDQPTMIVHPQDGTNVPTLWVPGTPILHPFGSDGSGGDGPNYMWAQGKDGAPFLQEAAVRYRPATPDKGVSYTLTVDYYLEFWNMSDHDVTAAQLGHNPFVRVSNQQAWYSATIARVPGGTQPISTSTVPVYVAPLANASPTDPTPPAGATGSSRDFNIDILNNVVCAATPASPMPNGVVFKAGTATVITTDPDCLNPASNPASVLNSRYVYGGQALTAAGFSAPNVYYCPSNPSTQAGSKRVFSGPINVPESTNYLRGVMPYFRGVQSSSGTYLDYEVEVSMGNDLGYIDCATGSVCISAGSGDGGSGSTNGYDMTWTPAGAETHNDYMHGGTLGGNTNTPSELGDPRTNNEQLSFVTFAGTSFTAQPDQSRYGAPGKSDAPPFTLGLPNAKYVKPATGAYPWGDYYDWPTTSYPTTTVNYATAPSVVADAPLTSIGQLGDLFDPVRVIGTVGNYSITNTRGGGRTLKIGQRDDRCWYDPSGNPPPNNTPDNIPASNGWASWRLTDVFSIADPLELPARVNINGVSRDDGAALRAALTGFIFQPQTQIDANGQVVDPRIHGAATLNNVTLKTLPTDTTGVAKLVSQINARLTPTTTPNTNGANTNTPSGPFFERGELGELENAGTAGLTLFGKNGSASSVSTDLTGKDLNHTFDRGREELFRRLAELICTRGDTFTVYAVGQSMNQTDPTKLAKITGTHRMRVTFRLVPKLKNPATQAEDDFHPGYSLNPDGSVGSPTDFDPTTAAGLNLRFSKPDLYGVQVLEVNTL